ncbi:ABC transporter ATP-binding protein [Natronomonas gomsonensis]|uniref:ABC transporter ATP-binding protein n=1 Tax=Natronomonas gomsonensis TaxID=1046043 RepID=UPI0020CA66AA|nr:ABC transporter ATP-binding protein [Natronomonas gomsonensis]MCY4729931.1 ABC transporter ATP-binding protein [Natronomonas gomsonensis]
MLKTESLEKRFGNLKAVNDVSIDIEEGEFRSLIGPNGAGKTTLFNLVTGALTPSSGQIYFDGENITDLEPHEIAQRGCSRSFQITSIFPDLSVEENLRVMAQAKLRGRPSMFKRKEELVEPLKRVDELVDLLDLEDVRERTASELSHGQKRHLEIGLTLARDPNLLMLDEPTAGMSQEETREIIDLLNEIKSDYTVLLVEHDMDVVMSLSDRIMVLHHGEVIAEGTPDVVRDDERVREAYLGVEETYV